MLICLIILWYSFTKREFSSRRHLLLRFYDKGLAGVWKTPASLTLDIQSNDTKYFFVIFQIFFEFIKLSLHIILSVWSILTTLFRMPCLQSALSTSPLFISCFYCFFHAPHGILYLLYSCCTLSPFTVLEVS